MIKILVADDHHVVRKGLAQIVSETPGMEVAAEARDGDEALKLIQSRRFDVVILDIAMPGKGGLEILQELKSERPNLKVIMLSIHSEEQYAVHSLKNGASAYLTKGSSPDELVKAIRMAASGKRYITPSVAERLASFVEDPTQLPHDTLSGRELYVLVEIGSGRQVKEIASGLHLSVKTVSTYRARLLHKMGMQSNAQLIRYAVEHGLVR